MEAAIAIDQSSKSTVTLSYRGEAFKRIKPGNRAALERSRSEGRIDVALQSNVVSIDTKSVTLEEKGGNREIPNDCVIVCAGGVLPTGFLRSIGIEIQTLYGTPVG